VVVAAAHRLAADVHAGGALHLRAVPADFGDGRKGNFAVWLFVGLTGWAFSPTAEHAVGGLLAPASC